MTYHRPSNWNCAQAQVLECEAGQIRHPDETDYWIAVKYCFLLEGEVYEGRYTSEVAYEYVHPQYPRRDPKRAYAPRTAMLVCYFNSDPLHHLLIVPENFEAIQKLGFLDDFDPNNPNQYSKIRTYQSRNWLQQMAYCVNPTYGILGGLRHAKEESKLIARHDNAQYGSE